jgi:hypothetical protein
MEVQGRKTQKNTLPNNRVNGCERTFGLDKSNPTKCNKPNKNELVNVNAKLTEN